VCHGVLFTADLAVRALVGVRQQVAAVESPLRDETRAAHIALVRFLSIVHIHVSLQRARQIEALRAHGALKAMLARVHQHVRLDVTGPLEPLAAYLTIVRAFLHVRDHVLLQRVLAREHLSTVVALEQTIDIADLERRRCHRFILV